MMALIDCFTTREDYNMSLDLEQWFAMQDALNKKEYEEGMLLVLEIGEKAISHVIINHHVIPDALDFLVRAFEKNKYSNGKKQFVITNPNVLRIIISDDLLFLCSYLDLWAVCSYDNIKYAIKRGKMAFVKYILDSGKMQFESMNIIEYLYLAFETNNIDMIKLIRQIIPDDWTNISLMCKYVLANDKEGCEDVLKRLDVDNSNACIGCKYCDECGEEGQCTFSCGNYDERIKWTYCSFDHIALRIGIGGSILKEDPVLIELFAPCICDFGANNREIMMDKIFLMQKFDLSKALIDGLVRSGAWKRICWCDAINLCKPPNTEHSRGKRSRLPQPAPQKGIVIPDHRYALFLKQSSPQQSL